MKLTKPQQAAIKMIGVGGIVIYPGSRKPISPKTRDMLYAQALACVYPRNSCLLLIRLTPAGRKALREMGE